MRLVRIQRNLLKKLEVDFSEHSNKVKALKYMFFYSQAKIFNRTRQELSDKIWLSRLLVSDFEASVNSLLFYLAFHSVDLESGKDQEFKFDGVPQLNLAESEA